MKMGSDQRNNICLVVKKKDISKVQVLIGKFAPLVKEDNFKVAENTIDFEGTNKPAQVFVHEQITYVSTTGTFAIDKYGENKSFKAGFEAQGLKQSF